MITLPIDHPDIQALHYRLVYKDIKTIACVGVTAGVGTTSIAYALARRSAASGAKTLLIDFDRIDKTISIQLACGQYDWMPETVLDMDIIQSMGQTGLSILSAPCTETLHWSFKEKKTINEMLEGLKKHYDMIVIDAGTVMQAKEKAIPAEIISAAADICVPVILSGKTNEMDIFQAKKILEDHGGMIEGYVMNDCKQPLLGEELAREVRRFERFAPKTVDMIATAIKKNVFLSQRF